MVSVKIAGLLEAEKRRIDERAARIEDNDLFLTALASVLATLETRTD